MGYPTKYQGPQIDEALEKGRSLRVVNNGWIKLDSSSSSPTNLGSLKNPGNYTTSYWTDGPNLGSSVVAPLNITVTTVDGILYQFAEIAGEKYCRSNALYEDTYGEWSIDQVIGAVNPGPIAPNSPTNGVTIWLDTSNAASPVLKLYSNDAWVEVVPTGAMQTDVYDPRGKKVDIYKYIDDAIAAASIGDAKSDFNSHISDTSIHVTQQDKDKWDSAATTDDIAVAVEELKPSIDSQIEEVVSESISDFEELAAATAELQNTVDSHVNNEELHPSIQKQAEWNAKSDAQHKHLLDNNVTISPKNIIGTIPSEMLPYDVKERVYEVGSLDAMYRLTKNPVHNGDTICVNTPNGTDWYFVINDEYLGTENASQAFKQFSGGAIPDVSWSSITGTPTTLSGYGITDAATKNEVTAIEHQIQKLQSELPNEIDLTAVADAQTTYNKAIDNLAILEAAIAALEGSVSKLEHMTN